MDALCVASNELRRQRISDQFGRFELAVAERELVTGREALKKRSLSKRDVSIGDRVKEAAFRRVGAASGDCRGGGIPGHAAVYVFEAVEPLVAGELTTAWK